jgi:hypothetical protein
VPEAHLMLVEEIVRQRANIFPAKYFETRIDAVHKRLDRGSVSDGDGGTTILADEDDVVVDISDSDDSDSKSSSSQLSSADRRPSTGGDKDDLSPLHQHLTSMDPMWRATDDYSV